MDFLLLLVVIFFGILSVGLIVNIITDYDVDFKDPVFIFSFVMFIVSVSLFVKVMNINPDAVKEVYISNIVDNVEFDKPMKITKTSFHKRWCMIVDNPEYYVESIK